MITVRISARSAVVRAGLEAIIRANGACRLAIPEMPPDVWLVSDSNLSDSNLTEEMAASPVPVVWLTEIVEGVDLNQFRRTGLRAVLPPDATPEEISAAICAAAAGLIVLAPGSLGHGGASRPTDDSDDPLTPREIEVLTMLADGVSNKVLAERLSISEHTAKFHVAQILAKLQAGSRTEAVTMGIRRGLILL